MDRLEEKGWLTRTLDPENRRSLLVTLSAEGKKAGRKMARLAQDLEGRLLAALTPEQLDGFRAVVAAVNEVTGVKVREG